WAHGRRTRVQPGPLRAQARADPARSRAVVKVAHVITTLQIGGTETALVRLLAASRARWPHGLVIALRPGPLELQLRALDVPVVTVATHGYLDAPAALLRVASRLRAFGPDLVHGWMCHASLLAQVAASMARPRIPVVWTLPHSLDDPTAESRPTATLIRAMALASRWPRRIVYKSRRSADQHEAAGYDPRRTVVIPNGFDWDSFRPSGEARRSVRADLGLTAETPLVGLVARVHHVKGHDTFLRAAASLVHGGSPAHFVLIGRDTDGAAITAQVVARGLSERVHCLGERRDVPRLTAALDV